MHTTPKDLNMSETPFIVQIEQSETKNCINFDIKEQLNPVIDRLKESAFLSEVHAYVTVDAKVRQNGDFWVELSTMCGSRGSGMEVNINPYTNVQEGLEFLRKLNRVTDDLIRFIEKNNLKTKLDD
jgi:hypothetical protein